MSDVQYLLTESLFESANAQVQPRLTAACFCGSKSAARSNVRCNAVLGGGPMELAPPSI